jgi:hypothetical protein
MREFIARTCYTTSIKLNCCAPLLKEWQMNGRELNDRSHKRMHGLNTKDDLVENTKHLVCFQNYDWHG